MTDDAHEIEVLLNRGIGLDVQSVGSSMVGLAIRMRMKKRSIKDVADYTKLVADSEAEFQALVEEIVVPETWFFRDREAFALLGRLAADWVFSHNYGVLRILSAPCSTGEEPYSIVMALLEAGLAPERFSVEAVDISAAALGKARRGHYSRNSFRGQHLEFRDKYFHKSDGGWQLDETVMSQVRFAQSNVLEPSFVRKTETMDIIFCRNMMIYFDGSARARLMNRLSEMLAPEGQLFLGHAESGLAHDFGFEPIPSPMVFAFRKRQKRHEAPVSELKQPRAIPPKPVLKTVLPVKALPIPLPKPKKQPVTSIPTPASAPTAETLLAGARKSADAGRISEARTECETCLKAHGPSVGAYYLLGLIEDADGKKTQAEEYYRKTLYLEPDHYEALFHLSLLAGQTGDAKAARQLQERARRAQAKATAKS